MIDDVSFYFMGSILYFNMKTFVKKEYPSTVYFMWGVVHCGSFAWSASVSPIFLGQLLDFHLYSQITLIKSLEYS